MPYGVNTSVPNRLPPLLDRLRTPYWHPHKSTLVTFPCGSSLARTSFYVWQMGRSGDALWCTDLKWLTFSPDEMKPS